MGNDATKIRGVDFNNWCWPLIYALNYWHLSPKNGTDHYIYEEYLYKVIQHMLTFWCTYFDKLQAMVKTMLRRLSVHAKSIVLFMWGPLCIHLLTDGDKCTWWSVSCQTCTPLNKAYMHVYMHESAAHSNRRRRYVHPGSSCLSFSDYVQGHKGTGVRASEPDKEAWQRPVSTCWQVTR